MPFLAGWHWDASLLSQQELELARVDAVLSAIGYLPSAIDYVYSA
jgi:hypothetical protein